MERKTHTHIHTNTLFVSIQLQRISVAGLQCEWIRKGFNTSHGGHSLPYYISPRNTSLAYVNVCVCVCVWVQLSAVAFEMEQACETYSQSLFSIFYFVIF